MPFFAETLDRATVARARPGFASLQPLLPVPRGDVWPDLSPGELLEAALLRLSDEAWKAVSQSYELPASSPLIASWEQELDDLWGDDGRQSP